MASSERDPKPANGGPPSGVSAKSDVAKELRAELARILPTAAATRTPISALRAPIGLDSLDLRRVTLGRPRLADDFATSSDIKLGLDRERLKGIRQDRRQRLYFAWFLGTSFILWMIAVMTVIVKAGQGALHLSDSVQLALLGTTTANVISLVAYVAKYLFHYPGADSSGDAKSSSSQRNSHGSDNS